MYENGFNLLPNLKKISFADVFLEADPVRVHQKRFCPQQVFFEHDCSDTIYDAVCSFVAKQCLLSEDSFSNLALQISEDLIIHRMDDNKDWMAAGHISFPSSWSPEEKIGRNFEKIHEPIPGMKLDNSRKLVETIINFGPFERFL